MLKEIDWENNRFEVSGGPKRLKITPKQSGAVIIPKMQTKFFLEEIKRQDGELHLEFPRGFQDEPDLKETAKRELAEETNLKAEKLSYLGTVMQDSGLINGDTAVYLAEINDLNQTVVLQKSEKIVGYKIVNLVQLLDLVKQNKIVDGYTLSAILKYIAHYGENVTSKLSDNVFSIDNLADLM